ncbi:MAG: hypothetical protein IE914_11185 [Thiotrichales bacterium]|nr:hypothetical protein [Thiotrichales bacterium]
MVTDRSSDIESRESGARNLKGRSMIFTTTSLKNAKEVYYNHPKKLKALKLKTPYATCLKSLIQALNFLKKSMPQVKGSKQ